MTTYNDDTNTTMPEWIAARALTWVRTHYVAYVTSGSEIVAQVWRTGLDRGLTSKQRDEETLANAHLIAAARELRSALRVMVNHAQETYPHFESERGQRDIAAAIAALRKSEDGQ